MSPREDSVFQLTDHLFRHESGKMVSVLSRLLGLENFETAQDLVQDTLMQAMNTWGFNGVPDNPAGWLYTVAKNKAIDFLRSKKRITGNNRQLATILESEYALSNTMQQVFLENEISDSQLRMIFACCHPSIPEESQLAIILKTLCGLNNREISRAFLTNEETIAKRIYRAKEKIRAEKIEMLVPEGQAMTNRLDTGLKSLYLLFNEGYNSSQPEKLIREELCEEAMRLCHLLSQHKLSSAPRVKALLALMCFQSSRLHTRLDRSGNIIVLKNQDRSQWDRRLIRKGFDYLEEAAEPFEVSPYHFEAGIASLHAAAPDFEKTDWNSIHHLYELLFEIQPSPVIAMNKAIASAYAISKEQALKELKEIKGLEHHHLYYATIGEIYLELKQKADAKNYFQKAIDLTSSVPERQLLIDKINLC